MGLNKGVFFSISGIVTVSVSKQDAINCNNACFCYLYMGSLFFIEFWRFFLIKYFFLSGKMLIVIMQHIIFPPFDAFEFIELRASSISWVLTNYAISYGVRDSQPKRVKFQNVSMGQAKYCVHTWFDMHVFNFYLSTCCDRIIGWTQFRPLLWFWIFMGFFSISFDLHYRVIYF